MLLVEWLAQYWRDKHERREFTGAKRFKDVLF